MATTGPVPGDAFGIALQRCWDADAAPGVAYEVVERDDGYIGVTDAAEYFNPPERWTALEHLACDRAAGRVLDIGCGAGRHAVPLRARGLDVTGLEPSPGAAAVARGRGVRVVEGAIEQPPVGLPRFDTLLLMGNNLGLLGGEEAAPLVLANLARLAAPDARLLGLGTDPHRTDVPAHLAYHDPNRRRGRMPGQLRIRVRQGTVASPWFDYLLASVSELLELLSGSPWRLDTVDTDDGGGYLASMSLHKPAGD
ncbi:MAG: class I SAM-dependent methyltransferase [Natronosporangium sp.]